MKYIQKVINPVARVSHNEEMMGASVRYYEWYLWYGGLLEIHFPKIVSH